MKQAFDSLKYIYGYNCSVITFKNIDQIKIILYFSALGAAALNDRLYVCGGFDGVSSLNIVECYQPDLDRWTIITPMQKHRSAGGVVAFDGYIYILGGHDGLSIFDSVS